MNTKAFQKFKAFCLSAILIIFFPIKRNDVLSTEAPRILQTDEGKNTNPDTIRLFGVTINPSEPGTSESPDGITHTVSLISHGVVPRSTRGHDSNEFCNTEDAPRKKKKRRKGREGPVDEVALGSPKRRRTRKEGWLEGSSAPKKSDLLSNTALENPQTQPLPPKSLQGNFHDSKSIVQGTTTHFARYVTRQLRKVGESYQENWSDLKEKVDTWVSNVEKILRDNSPDEGLEERSSEGHLNRAHHSIQNFMMTYLGLCIALSCYRRGQVDTNIIGNAWISEEKYLSTLKLKSLKKPKKEKEDLPVELSDTTISFQNYLENTVDPTTGAGTTSLYTLWYDLLDPKRKIEIKLSIEHFNAFLREIHNFGIEKLMCKEEIRGIIQAKTQQIDSSEVSLIAGRGKKKLEFLNYEKFLIGQGMKIFDEWTKASEDIQEQLTAMEKRIKDEVESSEGNTKGKGRKRKYVESNAPTTLYKSKSIIPSLAIGRVEKRLISTVFPAFFGLVEELNRKYGKEEDREAVLDDCLNYVKDLISKWNGIDYGDLLDQKIKPGKKHWSSRGHTRLDFEELFWNGAFYDATQKIPVGFFLELVQGWVKRNHSQGCELREYLANHPDELSPKLIQHLEDSYEFAQICPSRLPKEGTNKSQLVPFDFTSNDPSSKRTTRVVIGG